MRMSHVLGDARNFSVSVNSDYDAVQKTGEKITFAERRKLMLSRPDRLRVDTERSDGSTSSIVFTGKEIILIDATNNVYATEPQPGSIDEGVVHFVRDLGMRFPLAALLLNRLPGEFDERIRMVDYVEKTNFLNIPAHHLVARTDTVDFQIWISDGEQPVPLRIILTYRKEPGQPQFRAQFADWNFMPAMTATTFASQIPDGAQKIAFAAQLSQASEAMRKKATRKTSSNKDTK